MRGDHKKTKRDPSPSIGPFELIDKKTVVSGSSSGMCGSSSSRAILTENRPNGPQNSSNVSPVYEALLSQGDAILKQGERVDRALGVFEHQSESMKAQVAMLTVQGSILKQHSEAFGQLMKDHQNLQGIVAQFQTEVGRQGSVLEQHGTTLEMVKGRVDELWKGRQDNVNGNPKLPLRPSTRIQASGTPGARISASGRKSQQVQCSYCDKTLSSSYIRQHIPRCPALRPPRGSQ